jgi:ribonuclease HI
MLKLYTDGSCTNNGKKGAKAGFGVIYPDKLVESWGEPLPEDSSHTNQTAELTAIYEGLKRGATIMGNPLDLTVQVYTDSEYSINCLTKWVAGWKRNNWKTSTGKPVVHREMIEKIMEELKRYSGHIFTHVKAHTDGEDEQSVWNAKVDELARQAAEKGTRVTYADIGEVKIVKRTVEPTAHVLEGIPLALMGGPTSEKDLFEALKKNLNSLDQTALKTALISALKKTLSLKKYDLEKSKIFKTPHYKLIEENHLTINRLEDTNE